jgi:flagellar biosynthetic protein FlhB
MADSEDEGSKTEEPTQKRLDDAAEKGQLGKSQEINHWFMFLAAALALLVFGHGLSRELSGGLLPFLAAPHAMATDPGAMVLAARDLVIRVAMAGLPAALLFVVFAIGASVIQTKPVLSAEKIMPDFSRISPMAGFGRYFSLNSFVEFGKNLAKIAVIGAVAMYVIWPKRDWLPQMVTLDVGALLPLTESLTYKLLIAVISVMTLIAGGDLLYQKLSSRNKLRMTKQELRDEVKESDGDPQIKARLRAMRMERSRRRMMAMVPKADVVITNPTHYAVALQYDPATMPAPKVIAKGADLVAAKIRELANANAVPIVENPPLARALFTVDLDVNIPVEHYRAVAEIIGYVMRLKGKMPARR